MRRCFVDNFDYEHSLADPRSNRTADVSRFCAKLACGWRLVARDGDQIVSAAARPCRIRDASGLPSVEFVRSLDDRDPAAELVPWGWTETLLTLAGRSEPRLEAEHHRRANHRARSDHDLGARDFATLEDLSQHLRLVPSPDTRWILKAAYGMSGRQRLIGSGRRVAGVTRWVEKRLSGPDATVRFELRAEPVREVSWHITIADDGTAKLDGLTELLSTPQGQYRGNRVGNVPPVGFDIADAIGALRIELGAYRGPVSTDAMLYRLDSDELFWRARQDVNARWSMGRWALVAHERFGVAGGSSSLISFRQTETWEQRLLAERPSSVRILNVIDRRLFEQPPQAGLVFLTGDDADAVRFAEGLLP